MLRQEIFLGKAGQQEMKQNAGHAVASQLITSSHKACIDHMMQQEPQPIDVRMHHDGRTRAQTRTQGV